MDVGNGREGPGKGFWGCQECQVFTRKLYVNVVYSPQYWVLHAHSLLLTGTPEQAALSICIQ